MIAAREILEVTFWIAAAGVGYAYAGYPLLIWLLSRVFGRVPCPLEADASSLPRLSVLIAAHNEADVIAARIENALSLDYPADRLEIAVASDGSTDETPRIVQDYADRAVRLLEQPDRRGKAATLNAAVPQLTGDIVLLSDANTMTDPSAARALVRWFNDSAVGVVCGRLELTDPRTGRNADGLYWRYETFLKKCESRLGALLGSNGAIYAIRRDLWTAIPSNTIVDDFVIPLLAKQRSGSRIIYDTDAVAREETAPDIGAEFRRRARIGAGGFQAMGMLWRLMNPLHGWVAFTFLSHKVLRWLCPFLLVLMLAANIGLSLLGVYDWALIAQAAFYATSLLVPLIPPRLGCLKPLRLAPMFAGMNLALLVGFCRWLSGSQGGVWQRTARQ